MHQLEWEARHVVNALTAALTARSPRAQYLVGLDAQFAIALARWLPTPLYDRATAAAHGWGAVPRPAAQLQPPSLPPSKKD